MKYQPITMPCTKSSLRYVIRKLTPASEPNSSEFVPPKPHDSSHVSIRPLRAAWKQPELVPVLAGSLEQVGGSRGCHPGDPQTGWAGSTRSHITRVRKKPAC